MSQKQRKQALRAHYQKLRQALSADQKKAEQQALDRQALALLNPARKAVAVYLATPLECSCQAIIEHCWQKDIAVFAPKVQAQSTLSWHQIYSKDDFVPGAYGILEPKTAVSSLPNAICIFVPGVAFTNDGQRLGMGGGFYDRFLQDIADAETQKIGLAWSCQMAEELPAEAHDITMDLVLRPSLR